MRHIKFYVTHVCSRQSHKVEFGTLYFCMYFYFDGDRLFGRHSPKKAVLKFSSENAGHVVENKSYHLVVDIRDVNVLPCFRDTLSSEYFSIDLLLQTSYQNPRETPRKAELSFGCLLSMPELGTLYAPPCSEASRVPGSFRSDISQLLLLSAVNHHG